MEEKRDSRNKQTQFILNEIKKKNKCHKNLQAKTHLIDSITSNKD